MSPLFFLLKLLTMIANAFPFKGDDETPHIDIFHLVGWGI